MITSLYLIDLLSFFIFSIIFTKRGNKKNAIFKVLLRITMTYYKNRCYNRYTCSIAHDKTTKDYLSYILEYKMEVLYMNEDRKNMITHEDDDLSNMIHEYSKDNELRRKIDELKRQKEEEKRIYEAKQNSQHESIFDHISDTGSFKNTETNTNSNGIPDIRVDDTLIEKTRVGFEDQPAYDKTLIIMDNKTRASALEETKILDKNATSDFYDDEDYEENVVEEEEDEDSDDEVVYEDEEDDDDNLLSLINKRKKKKEDKDDDDDSEEDDSEDEVKTQKMNKIITYVIIGIVGICIVVAAFFGVRYALSNFFGGSDSDTPAEQTESEENTGETTEQPTDDQTDGSDDGNSVNIETNQTEIARLEKQLEQYENELDKVKSQLETAQKNRDDAQAELDSYQSLYDQAVQLQSQSDAVKTALDKVNSLSSYQNSTNPDEKAQYDAALQEYQNLCSQYGVADYQEIYAKASAANSEYNTKAQSAETKKEEAESQISSLNNRKTDLESKIADVTTQLNNYN